MRRIIRLILFLLLSQHSRFFWREVFFWFNDISLFVSGWGNVEFINVHAAKHTHGNILFILELSVHLFSRCNGRLVRVIWVVPRKIPNS